MENKILQEILTELKSLKQGLTALEQGQTVLQEKAESLEQGQAHLERGLAKLQDRVETVQHSQMNVELEWFPKINGALERTQNIQEDSSERDERIAFLEKKADIHDLRIYALEQSAAKAE